MGNHNLTKTKMTNRILLLTLFTLLLQHSFGMYSSTTGRPGMAGGGLFGGGYATDGRGDSYHHSEGETSLTSLASLARADDPQELAKQLNDETFAKELSSLARASVVLHERN